MKKTLVAVAALVAVTGAMAEATITGMIQVGTNKTSSTTSGASTTKTTLEDSNGNTGINIGVTEDLGDGMKFEGNIALTNPNTSGGTTASAGYQTFGALSGGFGKIRGGALYSGQFAALIKGDSTGYLVSTPIADITQHQGGSVGSTTLSTASMLEYTLPTFATGLTIQVQQKLGGATDSTGTANFFTLDYNDAGLNVGAVYSTYKYTTALTDTVSTFYGSYDFGAAKLFAMSATANTAGDVGVSGSSVGIAVPIGAAKIHYNYGSTNGTIMNGVAGASARDSSNVRQTGNTFVASYSLSKRTTAYAAYYKQTGVNSSTTAAAAATSNAFSTTRLMVMHAF